MNLTRRRYQFLEALVRLVEESGGPVHYGDVADSLDVSKWTAYDMMRELVAQGYVHSSYLANRKGEPGRSMVVFEPTERGLELMKSETLKSDSMLDEDWHHVASSLISRIGAGQDENPNLSLDSDEEEYESSPLSYCAALISLLLIEAKKTGFDLAMLKELLETSSQSGMSVSLFAGLLLGILLVQGARKILPDIGVLIELVCTQVEDLPEHNQDELLEFVQAAISSEPLT